MLRIIKKLYKINLLKPKGLYYLIESILKEGTNLMALLRFSSKIYPNNIAVNELEKQTKYRKLYTESIKLASLLKHKYSISDNKKVALLCRNHLVFIQSLVALSKLGVNVYLLNIEMSAKQLQKIVEDKNFDLIIYDIEKEEDIKDFSCKNRIPAYHNDKLSICRLLKENMKFYTKLKKYKPGRIVVLSGGTSGNYKTAGRKPSVTNFLFPFLALLTEINIEKYQTLYIATPLYHGFGLAALIVSFILGSQSFILKKYKTETACKLIKANQLEVIVLVPLMLQRMIKHDKSALSPLKCILSGGATLDSKLADYTLQQFGNVLYNLYGSSEAGFSIMAKPSDLRKYPNTIGKPIKGVLIKIVDENMQEIKHGNVGMICIKSKWTMDSEQKLVQTGDMGYFGDESYVFLKGRKDNMIVSGGENVYPEDLEKILLQNEYIENCCVIGIFDNDFGQRLNAFVVLKDKSKISPESINDLLKDKVARYQMPAKIVVLDSFPMLSTGKIDKSQLV